MNYTFKNKAFLFQALVHKSYADHIKKQEKIDLNDYNLMEFVGDSILSLILIDFFY